MRIGVRVGDALERDAALEDIGFDGARLRIRPVPSVGSIVRLHIDASTRWAPLEVDAIVRWVGETDGEGAASVGCEFAPLAPDSALALVEWLATLPLPTAKARG